MTKIQLQNLVNGICRQYKVPTIPLAFTDRQGKGGACYETYQYKIGGKIQKQHHPKRIVIYDWDRIKNSRGELSLRLGHELAHHIINMKSNSLAHTSTFYNLEEKLGYALSKAMK